MEEARRDDVSFCALTVPGPQSNSGGGVISHIRVSGKVPGGWVDEVVRLHAPPPKKNLRRWASLGRGLGPPSPAQAWASHSFGFLVLFSALG